MPLAEGRCGIATDSLLISQSTDVWYECGLARVLFELSLLRRLGGGTVLTSSAVDRGQQYAGVSCFFQILWRGLNFPLDIDFFFSAR